MNLGLKIFVKLSWNLRYWIFTSQKFKHTTNCQGAKRMAPDITKRGNVAQK